jgi:hypothetical protein
MSDNCKHCRRVTVLTEGIDIAVVCTAPGSLECLRFACASERARADAAQVTLRRAAACLHLHAAEGEHALRVSREMIAEIERLLDDPDPMVIERLAANPRLTERQVVTLVSTRPNRAERLEAVMAVSRWNRKAEVRSSVAQNPYAPTGLAIRALMFASRGDLDRIRFAGDLHPLLREAAAFFATLRDRTAPAD